MKLKLPGKIRIRERVDLTSSPDSTRRSGGAEPGVTSRPLGNDARSRKRSLPPVDDDDEVQVVDGPSASQGSEQAATDVEDDEVVCTKTRRGTSANRDLPHARPECGLYKFVIDSEANESRCPCCYCYCCEVPAADCALWRTHCHAHNGPSKWEEARAAIKRISSSGLSSSSAPATASGATFVQGATVFYYGRDKHGEPLPRVKAQVLKCHPEDESITLLVDGSREVNTVRERLRPAESVA